MEYEFIFVWALIVTITLGIMIAFVIKLRKQYDSDIQEMEEKLAKKQSNSYQMGQNTIRGELNQLLGSFAILNEYKQLASLSSVSKQFSIDLLGIKDDSVDFIEVKTMGTKLSPSENKVEKLITSGKVKYRIIEGNLPEELKFKDRE